MKPSEEWPSTESSSRAFHRLSRATESLSSTCCVIALTDEAISALEPKVGSARDRSATELAHPASATSKLLKRPTATRFFLAIRVSLRTAFLCAILLLVKTSTRIRKRMVVISTLVTK